MVRICAHAITRQFAINLCAACPGMFEFFQNQYPGTLAHHKTIAILVPWTAGRFGLVVARAQRARGAKPANAQFMHSRFGTASHHDVGITILDDPRCLANAVVARGAGGHQCKIGTLEAVHDGEVTRNHVDDASRNEEGGYLAHPSFKVGCMGIGNHGQTTDARADANAHAFSILRLGLDA